MRIHGVDVEKRRQPAARIEEFERPIDHEAGVHDLGPLPLDPVEPGEHVEALLEIGVLVVDDGVRDHRAGGEPLAVEHLREGHLARSRGGRATAPRDDAKAGARS